ncbi:hypothetical protein B0J17DRAFT_632865 [Rhizoctonia solani]|nr:hypothetical protein B0J17DRAFT_632865 [Rhizoctonia solani]
MDVGKVVKAVPVRRHGQAKVFLGTTLSQLLITICYPKLRKMNAWAKEPVAVLKTKVKFRVTKAIQSSRLEDPDDARVALEIRLRLATLEQSSCATADSILMRSRLIEANRKQAACWRGLARSILAEGSMILEPIPLRACGSEEASRLETFETG